MGDDGLANDAEIGDFSPREIRVIDKNGFSDLKRLSGFVTYLDGIWRRDLEGLSWVSFRKKGPRRVAISHFEPTGSADRNLQSKICPRIKRGKNPTGLKARANIETICGGSFWKDVPGQPVPTGNHVSSAGVTHRKNDLIVEPKKAVCSNVAIALAKAVREGKAIGDYSPRALGTCENRDSKKKQKESDDHSALKQNAAHFATPKNKRSLFQDSLGIDANFPPVSTILDEEYRRETETKALRSGEGGLLDWQGPAIHRPEFQLASKLTPAFIDADRHQKHIIYADLDHMIAARQKEEGWGAKVIPRLAADPKNELPEVKGFSERNIKRMLRFFKKYSVLPSKVPLSIPSKLCRSPWHN